MQTGYIKTSISLPPEIFQFLKSKAEETGAPISRLIAKAIREEAGKQKRRAGK